MTNEGMNPSTQDLRSESEANSHENASQSVLDKRIDELRLSVRQGQRVFGGTTILATMASSLTTVETSETTAASAQDQPKSEEVPTP